jgi:hypothetical protein
MPQTCVSCHKQIRPGQEEYRTLGPITKRHWQRHWSDDEEEPGNPLDTNFGPLCSACACEYDKLD